MHVEIAKIPSYHKYLSFVLPLPLSHFLEGELFYRFFKNETTELPGWQCVYFLKVFHPPN